MKKLHQLTEIFAGYSFRAKVKPERGGQLAVIQLRDVDQDHLILYGDPVRIIGTGIRDKYLLQAGDVLLIAKGSNNKAIPYDPELEKAVASSVFYVLRPQTEMINPAYLAWYLNHPQTQNILKSKLTGSYTLNLNRDVVEELEIPLPSLERQKTMADMDQLLNREKWLVQNIMERRTQCIQTQLMNLIDNK